MEYCLHYAVNSRSLSKTWMNARTSSCNCLRLLKPKHALIAYSHGQIGNEGVVHLASAHFNVWGLCFGKPPLYVSEIPPIWLNISEIIKNTNIFHVLYSSDILRTFLRRNSQGNNCEQVGSVVVGSIGQPPLFDIPLEIPKKPLFRCSNHQVVHF